MMRYSGSDCTKPDGVVLPVCDVCYGNVVGPNTVYSRFGSCANVSLDKPAMFHYDCDSKCVYCKSSIDVPLLSCLADPVTKVHYELIEVKDCGTIVKFQNYEKGTNCSKSSGGDGVVPQGCQANDPPGTSTFFKCV